MSAERNARNPTVPRGKDQPLPIPNVSTQGSTQLEAEWDTALLPALTCHREQQVVHVHVLRAQGQHLVDPRARIEQHQRNYVQVSRIRTLEFVLGEQQHLCRSERGEDALVLLQVGDTLG